MSNRNFGVKNRTAPFANTWAELMPHPLPWHLSEVMATVTTAVAAASQAHQGGTASQRAAVWKEVVAHSARVAFYTWCLARAMESTGRRSEDRGASAERLTIAALVHDVGKVAGLARLLTKPDRLTPAEFRSVQAHTVLGARIIDSAGPSIANPLRRIIAQVCAFHHERWNGSGYPTGRSGHRIPYCARLVSICDTYDAIVHDRVYAKSRSHAAAMKIIVDARGVLFDPDIVDAMLTVEPAFRVWKPQARPRDDLRLWCGKAFRHDVLGAEAGSSVKALYAGGERSNACTLSARCDPDLRVPVHRLSVEPA